MAAAEVFGADPATTFLISSIQDNTNTTTRCHLKTKKITHASQLAEHSSWRSYRRKLLELKLEGLPQEAFAKESAKSSFLAFCDLVSGAGGFALENAPLDTKAYEVIGSAFEDIAEGRYPILLVSMPPRSGKTTLGVHLLSWLLRKDSTVSHVVTSYDQSASRFAASRVKELISTPSSGGIFSKVQLEPHHVSPSAPGSSVCGLAYGGFRGAGVWLIDDYHKYMGNGVNSEWVEQIGTLGVANRATVVLGSRRGEGDIFSYFLEKYGVFDPGSNPNGAVHINLSAIIESEEEAKVDILGRKVGQGINDALSFRDPTFSPKNLQDLRKTIGDVKFSWLYKGVSNTGFGVCSEIPHLDKVIISIDPSCSPGNADMTGICVAGSTKEKDCVYVLDAYQANWDLETVGVIVSLAAKAYGVTEVVIESSWASKHWRQYLEKLGLPVRVSKERVVAKALAINLMVKSGKVASNSDIHNVLFKSWECIGSYSDIMDAILVSFMELLPPAV